MTASPACCSLGTHTTSEAGHPQASPVQQQLSMLGRSMAMGTRHGLHLYTLSTRLELYVAQALWEALPRYSICDVSAATTTDDTVTVA